MLNSLYGDANESSNRRASRKDKTRYGTYFATKTFEKQIKERLELKTSYCTNLFYWILVNMCCCCSARGYRVTWIRNGISKYNKFNLALQRLSKE